MGNFKKKHPMPTPGQIVEITARLCSPKQQQEMKIGRIYVVKRVASLKDGSPVLEVEHPNYKKTLLHISAQRFEWRIVTVEMMRNRGVVEQENAIVQKLRREFTVEEQKSMAFIPLIIQGIIIHYADKCFQYAAFHRIDSLKKVSRAVRLSKEKCLQSMGCLKSENRRVVEDMVRKVMQENANDFTVMYFTFNNEYKRIKPNSQHDVLTTNALIGKILTEFLKAWDIRYKEQVQERTGEDMNCASRPGIKELETYFTLYAGDIKGFNWRDNKISLCLTILKNKLNAIKFDVTNE